MRIKKLPNGIYETRIRIKTDGIWKEKRLRNTDKDTLMLVAAQAKKENNYLSTTEIKKWQLKEYYKLFIDTYKSGKMSYSTLELYRYAYEELLDYFGNVQLASITPLKYQKFINNLGKHLAISTVETRHKKVRAMMHKAVELEFIKKNPTMGAVMSGKNVSKTKVQFLDRKHTDKLEVELLSPLSVSRVLIYLALKTGMRFEELAALTWSKDIDFDTQEIIINKAWDYKSTFTFCDTKTEASKRRIYISKKTIHILELYKEWQITFLKQKNFSNKHNLIFVMGNNRPITNAACNKELTQLCEKLSIDRVTLHKLRHTHTVQAMEEGVDILYLAQRLGHSDTKVLMDVYAHVSDTIKSNNQKRLEEFL